MNADLTTSPLPPRLAELRLPALMAAAVGWLGIIVGAIFWPSQVWSSYLWAFFICNGISLGCLGLVMLHRLTGGPWGIIVRRPAEAAAMNLPLMAVLFIPIPLLGLYHLYPWTHPDLVAVDAVMQHKAAYLNTMWFSIRAAIYFAVWIGLAWVMITGADNFDRTGSAAVQGILGRVSAGGLVLFFLTTTLAGVDWIMSREPHWFSTILGLLIAVGMGCSAMSFLIIILREYFNLKPFKGIVRTSILNDLGNLLMTTVILWAYMSLAQFLITWMGNLQEEVPWYLRRTNGMWSVVAFLLIVLHFFVPFILLLSRYNKRRIEILGSIAAGVLVMRVIDIIWVIRPSDGVLRGFVPGLYIWDLFTPLAIGGLWLNAFLWTLSRRPLLPRNEPETVEILSHVEHSTGQAHGAV